MLLAILVLLIAAIGAFLLAYGFDPRWIQFHHGLQLILLTRRFEWPLTAITLLACIGLVAMIVAGRRRVWWLVGLAPILALVAHRFALSPWEVFLVNAQPEFVSADRAGFVNGEDWVVGVVDGGDALAFPYASIYSRPLVLCSDEPSPMLLCWSPFANSATAFHIDRSIRGNEIEIVSMPANALLVYNSRIGEFINGFTGLTPTGNVPSGFGEAIPVVKTTWERWVAAHPQTVVLAPPGDPGSAPRRGLLPYFPMPADSSAGARDATVALVRSDPPVAVLESDLAVSPANFSDPPIVVLRDPLTGSLEAFSRTVDDLTPAFAAKSFRKFPRAVMTDLDSGSAWTKDGRAVDGPLMGKSLQPVLIEDRVFLNVARAWYPNVRILQPAGE